MPITAKNSATVRIQAETRIEALAVPSNLTLSGSNLGTNTITSLQLAAALTNETGTGSVVFSTNPALVTPALGIPASGDLSNCTGTAPGLTAGSSSNRDTSGGVVGLTLFAINCRNVANTFTSFLTNVCTAVRTWTMPDKTGTVALKEVATAKTASFTLAAVDDGDIFVISGSNIDVTLPARSAVSSNWRVTLVNENSTNTATDHSSSPANKPVGQKNARILRAGADNVAGATTELNGASLLLPPRECMDIWAGGGSSFAAAPSRTVGWKDIPTVPRASGVAIKDPSETAIDNDFYRALEFDNAVLGQQKEVYYPIHINHDYVMGTRVYLHVHFEIGNTTATTTVGWGFQFNVAKGHAQEAYNTTGTTVYASQVLNGTPYEHYVTEVSDANAVSASRLEPDSVIKVRLFRDSSNTGGSGDDCTTSAWLLFTDCHYLSNEGGTPGKSPPFYL